MMKIVNDAFNFVNGDVLDPQDLNRLWQHCSEAVTDTFQRRYKEVPVVVSFTKDVATGYASTDNIGIRTIRFRTPLVNGGRIAVTRAFLNGNINSNAEVTVNFENTSGVVPTGCTDPWLSVASTASVDTDVSDTNPARFELVYNTEYVITLESTGTFTVNHLDLVFHVQADRFAAVGGDVVPTFAPVLVSESSNVDATVQAANQTNFEVAASSIHAQNDFVYTPTCFTAHGLNMSSAGTEPLRRFAVPKFGDTRATPVALQLDLWWYAASSVGAGNTIKFQLLDVAGIPVAEAVYTTSGGGQQSGFATFVIDPVVPLSIPGVPAAITIFAYDYSVRFVSSTPTVIEKAFGVLWVY